MSDVDYYDGPVPDPYGGPDLDDPAAHPPLPLGVAQVPAVFPSHCLPGWAARFVEAVTEAMQVPSALAGGLLLGALAVPVAGRVRVQVRPGFIEPTNVYVAPVLPPATRKSPVFKLVLEPLYEIERERVAAALPAIWQARTEREVAAGQAETMRRRAVKAVGDREAVADAVAAVQAAEAVQVPAEPRFFADDATPEAVAGLLAAHEGRLTIASAEGGFFELLAGRYSNGLANLDTVLKAYSGDPIRVDRRGREPEFVPSPALNLVLTVQPDVLRYVGAHQTMTGRGLLARFWFLLPPSTVGRRRVDTAPVPEALREEYAHRLRALAERYSDDVVLTFTSEAAAAFRAEEERIEPLLAPGALLAESPSLQAWAGKLVGSTARLVGLLHAAGQAGVAAHQRSDLVQAETVHQAVTLARWLAEHALATYRVMRATPSLNDAERVLGNLQRRRVQLFSVAELRTSVSDDLRDRDRLQAALDVLVDHGFIWRVETPRARTGRPPSDRYAVHPDVLREPREVPIERKQQPSVGSWGTSQERAHAHPEPSEPSGPPRCGVCGRPMVLVEVGQTSHPGCRGAA
ncbi:YfjI family protein [Kineococcus terrestris]|uniref:YfjI family protein n=1 Tax=Kineococcus terrestris TaxID=2044856 RepID=UPI0034DAD52A